GVARGDSGARSAPRVAPRVRAAPRADKFHLARTRRQGAALRAPRLRREPRPPPHRPRTRESRRILSGCRGQPHGGGMGDSRSCKAVVVTVVLSFAVAALSAEVTVTSITPASGLSRGGEIVHIHGTSLLGPPLLCPALACSTYVKFG